MKRYESRKILKYFQGLTILVVYRTVPMTFMTTTAKTKSKVMTDAELKALEESEYRKRFLAEHQPGIQISLRLPPATLGKLTRLASASFQTKSQYITKLLSKIPEKE
jgi:hypothetical protein